MSLAALHARAIETLERWSAPDAGQQDLRRQYLDFLAGAGQRALTRDGGAVHLTASCFVFDEGCERILLSLHRKGGFWVQFGGHLEADDDGLEGAALREGREESGIAGLSLARTGAFDLNRHRLSRGFGGCREHLDVAFVAICPATTAFRRSEESEDVAWWPVDALPAGVVEDLTGRVLLAAAWARGQDRRANPAANPSR